MCFSVPFSASRAVTVQFSRTIISVNVLLDGGEQEINEKDEFHFSDHSGAQNVEPKDEKEKPDGGGRKKTKPRGESGGRLLWMSGAL